MERNRSASEAFLPMTYAQRHDDDVKVPATALPKPRPDCKSDKKCILCGEEFGKVLNIVHAKRYCCSFCYRGVCAKCSPYTLKHPETRQQERCCNACYSRFVTQDIRFQMQDELNEQKFKVKELRGKVDEERQAEMMVSLEIETLKQQAESLREEVEEQRREHERAQQQLAEEEAGLKQCLEELRAERKMRQEKERRLREQVACNEEEAQTLKQQQEGDRRKAAELQARKAQLDEDLASLHRELQVPLPTEAGTDKNRRVAELQQALALERELLVKLQQENLALTQARSEKPPRASPKEHELGEVPPHEISDLPEEIAALRSENKELEAEVKEMKTTPEQDDDLERLRTAVAREKEENTKLMLQLQDRLLNPNGSEPLTRDKCNCCVF